MVGALALLAASSLGATGPAVADVFTVRDIPVDITAGNASEARDRAMAQAQRAGFVTLFDRLVPDSTGQAPPELQPGELERLVEGVEVQEERSSAVRYLARFAVKFRPQAIRGLFQAQGVRYAELQSKPVLVLAVDRTDGRGVLWDTVTDWRDAWARLPLADGLIPLTLPLGEIQDVSDIGAEEALAGDAAALARISARYRAGGVLVAVRDGAKLTATLHRGDGTPQTFTAGVPDTPSAQASSLAADPPLVQGARALVRGLEEQWAAANVLETGQQSRLTVAVGYGGAEEWSEARRRLARIPTVTESRLLSLARGRAELDLAFLGGLEGLRAALAQQDLVLSDPPAGDLAGLPELRLRPEAVPTPAQNPTPTPTTGTVEPAPAAGTP